MNALENNDNVNFSEVPRKKWNYFIQLKNSYHTTTTYKVASKRKMRIHYIEYQNYHIITTRQTFHFPSKVKLKDSHTQFACMCISTFSAYFSFSSYTSPTPPPSAKQKSENTPKIIWFLFSKILCTYFFELLRSWFGLVFSQVFLAIMKHNTNLQLDYFFPLSPL